MLFAELRRAIAIQQLPWQVVVGYWSMQGILMMSSGSYQGYAYWMGDPTFLCSDQPCPEPTSCAQPGGVQISPSSMHNITLSYSLFCSQKYLKFLIADIMFLGLLLANFGNLFARVTDSNNFVWVVQQIGLVQVLSNLSMLVMPSLVCFAISTFMSNLSRGMLYTYVIQTVQHLVGTDIMLLTIPLTLFCQAIFGLCYVLIGMTFHGAYYPYFLFNGIPLILLYLLLRLSLSPSPSTSPRLKLDMQVLHRVGQSSSLKQVLLLTIQKAIFNLYCNILYIESEDYSDTYSINLCLSLITLLSVSVQQTVLRLGSAESLRKTLNSILVVLLLSSYFVPPSSISNYPSSMLLNQLLIYTSRFLYDLLVILYQQHPLFVSHLHLSDVQFGLGGVLSTGLQLFVPYFSFQVRSTLDINPFCLYSILFIVYYLVSSALDNLVCSSKPSQPLLDDPSTSEILMQPP